VRHLLGDFLGAGAGIGSDDQSLFDRKLRIFQPTQLQIGDNSTNEDKKHRHKNDAVVADREFANVHRWAPPDPLSKALPKSRAFIPSGKNVTPATAMRSPGCNPSVISTCPPAAWPIFTGWRRTVWSEPIPHATCSPVSVLKMADMGTSMRLSRMLAR